MCLDHGLEDVFHSEDFSIAQVSTVAVGSANPICDRQNGAQVVTGVTPLSGKPAVVEIEPSDHGTDVEGTEYRIELVGGAGNSCTIGDSCSGYDRAQKLGAVGELKGLETATQRVEEDVSSCVDLHTETIVSLAVLDMTLE